MKCPYCGHKTKATLHDYIMSDKKKAIFQTVADAGNEGMSEDDLWKKHFEKGALSKATIKTTIHGINQVIRPLRIISRCHTIKLTGPRRD